MILALDVLRLRGSADPVLQHQREVLERQVRQMARLIDELCEECGPRATSRVALRL
jgi:hypothetical protein